MIKKLSSKKRYILTKELKKTIAGGFHDGFIWGSTVKIKKH